MRNLISLTCLCLLLSGCLGKMEHITEETRDQVKATNDRLSETTEGQLVLSAISDMTNPSKALNDRVAGAMIFFAKAPDIILPVYLGARLPTKFTSVTVNAQGKRADGGSLPGQLRFPNVSVVQTESTVDWDLNWRLGIAPMDQDLYNVESLAISLLLERMQEEALVADGSELEDLKARAWRMIDIAPTVLGAVRVEDLRSVLEGGSGRPSALGERAVLVWKQATEALYTLARTLNLGPKAMDEIRAQTEAKLGFQPLSFRFL